MAKFILLYSGGSMPESEAEVAAVMKAWETWYGELGEAVLDPGDPFTPVASIASDGIVSEGSAGLMASGYTILNAGSHGEAVKMAKGCPILQGGGEISIFEAMNIM
jgi:hypothetical protein